MINEFEYKDYLQEMRDRVTITFEEKIVLDKVLQLFSRSSSELQLAVKEVMQERSIDNAVGKQLDIIGNIVGQPREIKDAAFVEWFGYNGWPGAAPYGNLLDPSKGGAYWDGRADLTEAVLLDDSQFRVFIKAKIVKNVTKATPEDMIDYLKFVFNASFIRISEQNTSGELDVNVTVAGNFSDFEVALLSSFSTDKFDKWFFPKPLGVGIMFNVVSAIPFIYAGGAAGIGDGYGSVFDPTIGGTYAGLV